MTGERRPPCCRIVGLPDCAKNEDEVSIAMVGIHGLDGYVDFLLRVYDKEVSNQVSPRSEMSISLSTTNFIKHHLSRLYARGTFVNAAHLYVLDPSHQLSGPRGSLSARQILLLDIIAGFRCGRRGVEVE